ncbi:hypothetical protein [Nocardia sp. NPDC058633]|uniref:hypothetical protein n=1 Tax=Nocardia sp. NPDC058633 TaxID=3346568 RepID=UPI00364BA189
MPDQTAPSFNRADALAGLLGILASVEALTKRASRAAEDEPSTESPDADGRKAFRTFATAAEVRADFLSANRELMEEKAVAIVVLTPRGENDVQAAVMTLPGMCAYKQAIALQAVADSIANTHSTAECDRRRADTTPRN